MAQQILESSTPLSEVIRSQLYILDSSGTSGSLFVRTNEEGYAVTGLEGQEELGWMPNMPAVTRPTLIPGVAIQTVPDDQRRTIGLEFVPADESATLDRTEIPIYGGTIRQYTFPISEAISSTTWTPTQTLEFWRMYEGLNIGSHTSILAYPGVNLSDVYTPAI